MAGFDLSKVGELIKNVEAQVLKNGGETNSDGEINTADESSIFNSIFNFCNFIRMYRFNG